MTGAPPPPGATAATGAEHFGPPPGGPSPDPRARRAAYLPPGGLGSRTGVLPTLASRRYALPTVSRPGIVPLRPLGLSDILDGAVKHVRRNPGPVLGWAAIANCLAAAPLIVGGVVVAGTRQVLGGLLGADWAMFFAAVTGVCFGVLLLTGILSYPVAEAVLGRKVTLREVWQHLRPRAWALLGSQVLVAAVTILPWVVLVVLVTALGDAPVAQVLAVVLFGGLLVVALQAWAVPRLVFLGPLVMLEERGVRAAWSRSWQLSRRRYWAIVGAFLTCALIVVTVFWMIELAFVWALLAMVSVLELPYDANALAEMFAVAVATLATASLITPFLASTTVLQYIDSRIRSEGFDLVLMRAATERVGSGPEARR